MSEIPKGKNHTLMLDARGKLMPVSYTHLADALSSKIATLRVFTDENDKMNLSLADIDGEVLVTDVYRLFGNVRRLSAKGDYSVSDSSFRLFNLRPADLARRFDSAYCFSVFAD